VRSSAMRSASRSRKLKRFPSVWLLETPPDGRPTTRPVRSAWVIESEADAPRLVSAYFRQPPVLAPVTRFFQALFLTRRLAGTLVGVAGLFVAAYFAPALAVVARLALTGGLALLALDLVLLWRAGDQVAARRHTPERLSNGDWNEWRVEVENRHPFRTRLTVADELPEPFQARSRGRTRSVSAGETETLRYAARPVRRGVYAFGALNVYAATPVGLAERRYRFAEGQEVPVYPSFKQMRRYRLLAASDRLDAVGVKTIRRRGHAPTELDHLREYVRGDDPRHVNWKATARRDVPITNQYRAERGQPVWTLLDTGRVMKMPFEQMTLLDHAVNAALAVSAVALQKDDRAGLVTFSDEVHRALPPEQRGRQLHALQEALYHVGTGFAESSVERLAAFMRRKAPRRGLLLLFTNFATRSALDRQLPYLKDLAQRHTVVVIFFENAALRDLRDRAPETTEAIYHQTIAEQFAHEKRRVVRTLRRHGCQAVLTAPEDLTTATLNKYLELKARGMG